MWGCYGGHVMKVPSVQCWDTESAGPKLTCQQRDSEMDENSPSSGTAVNGQTGPSVSSGGVKSSSDSSELPQQQKHPQYSIPGILHFIQHEWARFEMERNQWEIDRAELQARIAFLQGERKGQENLKHDLVRRIKMLEFSLKQERAKFYKLKYGTDPPQMDLVKPRDEAAESSDDPTSVNVPSWKQGRQLLRQYLNEIGYTDTIIDTRSQRVRSLLGLRETADEAEPALGSVNGNDVAAAASVGSPAVSNKRPATSDATGSQNSSQQLHSNRQTMVKKGAAGNSIADLVADTESAIMSTYSFLGHGGDVDDDDEGAESCDDPFEVLTKRKKVRDQIDCLTNDLSHGGDVDAEAEMILSELTMLSEGGGAAAASRVAGSEDGIASGGNPPEWAMAITGGYASGQVAQEKPPAVDGVDGSLGLGELAQLTVNNEAEQSYEMSSTKEVLRRTWSTKFILRNHFDSVRALAFHPSEPVLITGSEDKTLKLWNLQKTVAPKKSTSLDVEPVYTFRGHRGYVLALAMNPSGSHCFSGDCLGNIRCWGLPNHNVDPYDPYDASMLHLSVQGHSDAIWGVAVHPVQHNFLTCSADGTVKLWTANLDKKEITAKITLKSDPADGVPTSVDFVGDATASTRALVSYTQSQCVLFDCETGKAVTRLDAGGNHGLINRAISHPDGSLSFTAGDDRNIRFFDNTSGQLVHTMVAHLDSVTSLAVDPQGLCLISGSHDCSIRLWTLDSKTCIQEITAHRKKYDESILAVAFHPSRTYIASGGADGLAKVFV